MRSLNRSKMKLFLSISFLFFLLFSFQNLASAQNYFVSTSGNNTNPGTESLPWRTIQKACNSVRPGDTVYVKAGTYNEKIMVNVSGDATGGYITIQNYGVDKVVISGNMKKGANIVTVYNKSYLKIIGFEIRDNYKVIDGSGIRISGLGRFIEIRNNVIHNIRGKNAMGLTVYAHESGAISNLIIDGNLIYDCNAAPSEALTLNGNVWDFQVTRNIVHDVNNIGIDFIGGEVPGKVVRRGLCAWNEVYRARSSYGGGYAAGIYVDGAVDVTLEGNRVHECDLGIEVGCENAGYVASGIVVQNNLLYNNDKAGLAFGGYAANVGQVKNCIFRNNTLYKNETLRDGEGELWIQYASECIVRNNVIQAGSQNTMLSSWEGNINNSIDYNCWVPYALSSGIFIWNSRDFYSLNEYQIGTRQDGHSIQKNPRFLNETAFDFHLQWDSPCIDVGDPSTTLIRDFEGTGRSQGVGFDIGADEF